MCAQEVYGLELMSSASATGSVCVCVCVCVHVLFRYYNGIILVRLQMSEQAVWFALKINVLIIDVDLHVFMIDLLFTRIIT